MPRSHSWSELKVGLISGAVVLAIVLGVLFFARVGALHGKRDRLFVLTNHAPGVLPGTEVWLAGEKVGLVKAITFRPASTDTSRRVMIETEILSTFMPQIRKTSYADLRPGGNLIGSPVVYISPASSASLPSESGDTISTKSVGVIKDVGENVTQLVSRLTVLADSTSKTISLLNSEAGAVGAFARNGLPRIASVTGTMSQLLNQAAHGNGTAGLLARGDVGARFRRVLAAKDSITRLMSTGNGTLGRFHRDSTLGPTLGRVRAEVDSLRSMMSSGNSSISRMKSDTTLAMEMTRARAQLDSLMKDVKKHPRKYL
ncbi:MAG: MlaD family protein [Gemmatimonadaceae bacterium]